ncbi:MAG TPA: AI-2E family transporter [Patescibacteria group bacterium]|nr:AI-2E family transporter [Patescibacteria group bacterium]
MTVRLRTIFYLLLGVSLLWLIYIERSLLAPIVIGGIFAYLFNPIVNFFSKKAKLPRSIAVFIVYLVLMTILICIGTIVARTLFVESSEIRSYATSLLLTTKSQINTLPDWLRPSARSMLVALQHSQFGSSLSLLPYFPKAVSRIINFFIFLVSGFYFLQDGNSMYKEGLEFIPARYKSEVETLFQKFNTVFAQYLRGQLFLICLMSVAIFIPLVILGVRFSGVLAVFSGLAELVPIVGPITAAVVSIFVLLITGHANFGLNAFQCAIIIAIIYFIFRQIEDYVVIPHIMGKIVKLPAFVVFLSVIAGGHLWGILGLILAVPIAAIIKILLEFSLGKIEK